MKRMLELQEDLSDLYDKVVSGDIPPYQAKVASLIAGRLLSSATLQLKYKIATSSNKPIQFLETEETSND